MSTPSLSTRKNLVIREVRDREGVRLGTVMEPYDSTVEGMIEAARVASERMFTVFPDSSNIQSRMCATDDAGKAKFSISPNFLHVAEVGTDEARYTLGHLSASDF